MKLIDKATAVAEIERAIDEPAPSHDSQCRWEDGYYGGLYKATSIIDTLEVKEVDLGKEIKKYIKDNICGYCVPGVEETAKHFFELGMAVSNKVQKGK